MSVSDPFYVVQGLWSDGRIESEDGSDTKAGALRKAKALLHSSYFEGSRVRVITRDGELVWQGRLKSGSRRRRSPKRNSRGRFTRGR